DTKWEGRSRTEQVRRPANIMDLKLSGTRAWIQKTLFLSDCCAIDNYCYLYLFGPESCCFVSAMN
ncbi:hypothetical protein, partial [Butyricimonas faecihominis]